MLNLVKAYEFGILKKAAQKEEKPRKFFYISDLGKCERSIIYKFTDLPKKPKNPNEIEKMDMANIKHERTTGFWEISGEIELIGKEITLNRWLPPMWHGRTDGIFNDYPKIGVGDIKNPHPKNFEEKRYSLLKPQHDHQLIGYMMGVIKMLCLIEIPDGYLFYVDCGGSNTARQFFRKYTQKNFDDTKALMEAHEINLELFRKEGIFPPFLELIRKKSGLCVPWNCDYCDYQGVTCRIKEDLL